MTKDLISIKYALIYHFLYSKIRRYCRHHPFWELSIVPSNSLMPETLLTLDTEELEFVKANITEKNRLTFALMLKFFHMKSRYPTKKDTLNPMIIHSLSNQLRVSPSSFEPFRLENRTGERFRKKIREFLGYKLPTLADSEKLIAWLIDQAKDGLFIR